MAHHTPPARNAARKETWKLALAGLLLGLAGAAAACAPAADEDGSTGASPAPPQYPAMLRGYVSRPPWKVAGVDYAVGFPPSQRLLDWRSITQSGVSVDGPGQSVTVSADRLTLDAIDFSLHGGARLILRGNADVVRNSRFAGPASVSTGIIDVYGNGVTIAHNLIDGGGLDDQQAPQSCLVFIRSGGDVVMQYNWFRNMPARIVEFLGDTATRVLYRYNLIENGGLAVGSHMNYLESDGAGPFTYTVRFNTSRQTVAPQGPGEGYQFYCNARCTVVDPVVSNNTMISVHPGAMSYLVHGIGRRDGLIGTARMQFNYVDASSAYGAYYPHSFDDWATSDNLDMTSGSLLGPAT